jgi:hypothetical protein
LPGKSLGQFSSDRCLCHLAATRSLREELATIHLQAKDLLGAALPRFAREVRRLALTIRRSCFAGRSLHRYQGLLGWQEADAATGGLLARALALEAQVEERERAFNALYETELDNERAHLCEIFQHDRLLRGIALGNHALASRARACPGRDSAPLGRRDRRLERTLIRFVTRAAAKLSPYSTLTTVALGTIQPAAGVNAFRFVDGPHREASLVRANRFVLDRCVDLLLLLPSFRAHFLVSFNDTVRETEPGRFRFLRRGHWKLV